MGRKGSKRRGQRNAGGGGKKLRAGADGPSTAVTGPPAAAAAAAEPAGDDDDDGGDADRSAAMPWMRWQVDGLDARREHKELAEWREKSFTNEMFEAYYRRQRLLEGGEREWPLFLGALRRPLPTTFRLHGAHPGAGALRAKLRAGGFALERLPAGAPQTNALRAWQWRGKRLRYLCRRISALPQCEAYQIGLDRAGLRQACPKFKVLYPLLATSILSPVNISLPRAVHGT